MPRASDDPDERLHVIGDAFDEDEAGGPTPVWKQTV